MEMQFFRDWIEPRMESGVILDCKRQVSYMLQDKFNYRSKAIPAITYKSDFDILFSDGRLVVIDIKGHADTAAKLKRKLFYKTYPHLDYQWITKSAKYGEAGWIDYDKLEAIQRKNKKERKNGSK